ncbi:MAG: ATP-binding protein [Candidatus Binataceae bacterium]
MASPTLNKKKWKAVSPPLIGSFLLESITTGMYGERRNAIREYVQNSFDGIQAAIADGVIRERAGKVTVTVDADNKSLIIHDNGAGLPQRIAVNTLTAVGASRKKRGQQAGFRGIGRLAGIAFSTSLRFRTKAAGDAIETIVEFDCDELRKGMLSSSKPAADLITTCTTWDQQPVSDTKAHYFEVSLLGLKNAPIEASDPLQLATFLSQVAPVDFLPEFATFRTKIFDDAEALAPPPAADNKDGNDIDWSHIENNESSMLGRIPVSYISLVIRNGNSTKEQQVYKPYRPKMGVDNSDNVPLSRISVHHGKKSGAWWGWVGHKTKPGEYEDSAVGGLRFRLKNIQIDANELILLVPTTNDQRSTFGRWSEWFIGEIHLHPNAVVPNARRDNFEEDEHWLAIREEITEICTDLTAEARKTSKEHQGSLEVLEKKVNILREGYLRISKAKTFDVTKVRKVIADSDKIQKDIESASSGAPAPVQLRLKSMAKELSKIRVSLLEKPKTPEYEQLREAIRREFLDKALSILNNYLDIELYEDVRAALEKEIR